jgi:hypothetical protein
MSRVKSDTTMDDQINRFKHNTVFHLLIWPLKQNRLDKSDGWLSCRVFTV